MRIQRLKAGLLLTRALLYRLDEELPRDGFVYIYRMKARGWTLVLDRPKSFEPGVFFVGATGEVFCTAGGNKMDGAEQFEPVAWKTMAQPCIANARPGV